jgi:hypothetical protein
MPDGATIFYIPQNSFTASVGKTYSVNSLEALLLINDTCMVHGGVRIIEMPFLVFMETCPLSVIWHWRCIAA